MRWGIIGVLATVFLASSVGSALQHAEHRAKHQAPLTNFAPAAILVTPTSLDLGSALLDLEADEHSKRKRCGGFMPRAQCPKICKVSRGDEKGHACSACKLRKWMPKSATCRRTNKCTKYKFMPRSHCSGGSDYDSSDDEFNGRRTTAPPTGLPTPTPTKATPASTTAKATVGPVVTPALPKPVAPVPPKPATTTSNSDSNKANDGKFGNNNNNGGANGGKGSAANGGKGSAANANTGAQANSTSSGISVGAIVGICVGCAACAGAVGFFIWKKKKDQSREQEIFGDAHHDAQSGGGDYAAM